MRLVSPVTLLRDGWRAFRGAWLPITAAMVAGNLLLALVVSPLIGWLFREAMRANGMVALDLSAMRITGGIGVTLGLIFVILLIAFWFASLQFVVLVTLLRFAREESRMTVGAVAADVGRVMAKLARPSSMPLFFYLFFILPLSGFGFASVLAQGIAVPTFISGELLKSPTSAAIWTGFLLLLALLNLRFALSLPAFALTDATGGKAMRLSWRWTRGFAAVRLFLAGIVVLIAAVIATVVLVVLAIVPTALSDELTPGASPAVAAFSLGIAQTLGMLLTAIVTSLLAAMLVAAVPAAKAEPDATAAPATESVAGMETAPETEHRADAPAGEAVGRDPRPTPAASPVRTSRRGILALTGVLALLALGFGIIHIDTMQELSRQPGTLVLGHRGFSDGGAENTIGGLEAAAAAGVDLVEIDVMQAADGGFVVMHDSNLSRLTGQNLAVKDLTVADLTALTVRDQYGHEGKIPTLAEYIGRANELEMPLLIEIKLSGAETPDHVDRLVAELDALDGMDRNIFHTLDGASVTRLKELRPDATVGYILAFAGIDVPETVADFVVIEEWSATPEMQATATQRGLGFFSWTVNDEAGIRELLRRDADGIITDHPDVALAARAEMQQEIGLAGVLVDALTRFVVVF